jgi:hypothetical protein
MHAVVVAREVGFRDHEGVMAMAKMGGVFEFFSEHVINIQH